MMFREHCTVLQNERVAPFHYVLRLKSSRIAGEARPGQFVQIVCSDAGDPLLPRPFSFLTATKSDFSVLYQVVGKGTEIMSQLKRGESPWTLGPLGNGFWREDGRGKREEGKKRVLVGGGVGIPPLFHLAQEFLKKKFEREDIHVFLGAKNTSVLLCEEDFKKLGITVHVATDDGSKGHKGFITEALEKGFSSFLLPLSSCLVYACGPTPMLKAVSKICGRHRVPCEVSVEVPMACGFGACLGCAIEIRSRKQEAGSRKGGPRYAMACVEGPVFSAEEIIWG